MVPSWNEHWEEAPQEVALNAELDWIESYVEEPRERDSSGGVTPGGACSSLGDGDEVEPRIPGVVAGAALLGAGR
ncbi:hypothetical protein COV05_01300 [Candidatus Uhrbacteria bacterium CG10_big_fil_rev_8_21_14_0_10_48_16]|uniref:Uncharacterized protein n=1 Tax=Candidatus Uhrbacteria bacterium CG10_big_fil_rev_8_21_14_0_10_48_16 TaxID=1975038 RepID=A0A2M8LHX0_9BACT|nr:MAG: hypothetical protein COV05_01300 [Candidatus Uhrbacteria bacterium CG10_big_fil_rev_8_21_14_0_10_48_16]